MRLDFEGLWPYPLTQYGTVKNLGACPLEVVAHLAGQELTDDPLDVSPVLRLYTIIVADGMPNAERQKLKRLLPLLIGTLDEPVIEEQRADFLAKWALGIVFPLALDAWNSGKPHLAKWMRQSPGFKNCWWRTLQRPILALTENIPLVNECARKATDLFKVFDAPRIVTHRLVSNAADLVVSVMSINDVMPRWLCFA